MGDVASDAVRSHLISSKPDGGKSQLLHPQMARPTMVLLSCWSGWMELTPATLKSITLGYRQEKARLVMELRDSSDRAVADANSRVETGRKWRAKEEVQKVMGRLQHQQIGGHGPDRAGRPRME